MNAANSDRTAVVVSVASQQTVRFRISPRSLGAAVAHFSSSTPICCALEQGHDAALERDPD